MSAALVSNGARVSARALLAAASLALCGGGAAMIAQGAMVPVRAKVAQVGLDQAFEREMAANVRTYTVPSKESEEPIRMISRRSPAFVAAPRMLREPAPAAAIAPGKPLARITVRRLGVREVILAGPATHEALAKGPMMVKRGDAASPVTVLAAHRDTHFLFIRDLREGDIVTMRYVTGEAARFRVTHFETVRWDAFAYPLDPPRELLALTTCYPFGGTEYGGPWRRVAWAEAI